MNRLPVSVLSFFIFFVKKQPLAFFVFFISPITVVLEANIIPYALKMIIDLAVEYDSNRIEIFTKITPALYLLCFAWVTFITIIRLQNWLQSRVIPKFEAKIRMTTLEYIFQHSYKYFIDNLSGSIANKIADLPRALESLRMIICWNCIPTIAVVSIALIMLSTINMIFVWVLGLWFIIQVCITSYFAQYINLASEKNAEHKSALYGTILDTISNIIFVKLFSTREHELQYINKSQKKELISNSHLISTMNIFQLCMDIPVTIMLGTIIYFLLHNWYNNNITTGDFVFIFNSTYAIMYQVWYLGNELANLFRDFGIAKQALDTITQKHEILSQASTTIKIRAGKIIFNNVSFYYNDKETIFNNLTVVIEGGTKVGLVGLSGSGKSTFINLLLRLYDIKSGNIFIDDQNIKKVSIDSLHKNISIVPQETNLFHRTIIDNIRYGNINASYEEIVAASIKADCHNFILQLPNGYDTIVGERGADLSGGQKQRIAIARAILKNAPILILDEATSSLDSLSEKNIFEQLNNVIKNKTSIIITHKLSTIIKLDKIIVVKNGKIVEEGVHFDLLEKKGHYSEMWKKQYEGFLPMDL